MPRKDRPPKGQNPHGGKRENAGRPPGPNGRGAAYKHLRELARSHTEDAIQTLAEIMHTSNDPWVRIACADAILNRAFGKPREGHVVEQEDILAAPVPDAGRDPGRAYRPGPTDLRAPKLIERDDER